MKWFLALLALIGLGSFASAQSTRAVLNTNTTPSPSLLGNIITSMGAIADTNLWTGANTFSGTTTFTGSVVPPAVATPTLVLAGGTCAGTVIVGGLVGKVTLTGACASTNTMTLSVLPAVTHDYVCTAQNRAVPANLINETSTSTTTAVFTFAGTTSGATDVLQYSCQGY